MFNLNRPFRVDDASMVCLWTYRQCENKISKYVWVHVEMPVLTFMESKGGRADALVF